MTIELTDTQRQAIAVDIYRACLDEFGAMTDDRHGDEVSKAILSAFARAKQIRTVAAEKHDIDPDTLPAVWEYVASAYWMWVDGDNSIDASEVVPGCLGSSWYLNFARAFSILQFSSATFSLFMNDGTDSDYIEDVNVSLF